MLFSMPGSAKVSGIFLIIGVREGLDCELGLRSRNATQGTIVQLKRGQLKGRGIEEGAEEN